MAVLPLRFLPTNLNRNNVRCYFFDIVPFTTTTSCPAPLFSDLMSSSPIAVSPPQRKYWNGQVARLVEENRGLRHRLAKYEASPQQARYKYARQQTTGPSPRSSPPSCPGSRPSSSRGPRNSGGGNKAQATGRSLDSGGSAAAAYDRRAGDRHNGGGGGGVSGGGSRNCGNPVSCLNSRESAAFADRGLHC